MWQYRSVMTHQFTLHLPSLISLFLPPPPPILLISYCKAHIQLDLQMTVQASSFCSHTPSSTHTHSTSTEQTIDLLKPLAYNYCNCRSLRQGNVRSVYPPLSTKATFSASCFKETARAMLSSKQLFMWSLLPFIYVCLLCLCVWWWRLGRASWLIPCDLLLSRWAHLSALFNYLLTHMCTRTEVRAAAEPCHATSTPISLPLSSHSPPPVPSLHAWLPVVCFALQRIKPDVCECVCVPALVVCIAVPLFLLALLQHWCMSLSQEYFQRAVVPSSSDLQDKDRHTSRVFFGD